ncbi:unnamed protein product, partial [Hapterophycus canaliculatus]
LSYLRSVPNPQAKGLEPTVFTFRHALAACSGSGSPQDGEVEEDGFAAAAWERCRSLMDAMGRAGLQPDRLCYKYAVDAAAKVRSGNTSTPTPTHMTLPRRPIRGGYKYILWFC